MTLPTLTEIERILAVVVAVSVAVPVIALGWRRYILRPYRRLVQVLQRIDKVYEELTPNGGGSVKDQINKLAQDVKILRAGLSFSLTLNPHCVFEAEPNGNFSFANVALCDLLGMSQEELMGRGWLSALDGAEAREAAWHTWSSCVAGRIPYLDRYQVRNPRTGEKFPVRAHATPAGHPEKPLHYYGTIEREV